MQLRKPVFQILITFLSSALLISPAKAESLSHPLYASDDLIWAHSISIGGTYGDLGESTAVDSIGFDPSISSTVTRAQIWTPSHQITYFQGNKSGAVSISFDDGLPYQAQDTNGVSQLNARGLKGTFFVVTDWVDPYWRDSWATWQSVAAQGHEVASHTVTHLNLTTLSDNEIRWELSKSQLDINQNIPGKNTISLSYPNTAENSVVDAIASDYYVASRVAWANEGTYLNFYQPFNDEYGSYSTVNFNTVAGMEMDGLTISDPDFNTRLDKAIMHHAWFNLYFHSVADPIALGNILDYVQGKQAFWIDTFGNVSRYMKERLNSTIQVITDTSSEIRLRVVMVVSLPTSIYNVPLTLRSTVPASWTQVIVQQGSAIQTITPIIEGSDRVVYYNALPNGGDIVLIPLNPVLGLISLNPVSTFVGGSSFTLTVAGTNFVNDSIVRWNNSDRATNYISPAQLTVSIPASDIASIGTADVRVFNPLPSGDTSNQLYFAITATPITITVSPGQSKVYGGTDPVFAYASSGPGVTLTGALSRVSGENVGAYAINQGTLVVADSNYAIEPLIPSNFAITAKPITITVSPSQSKAYGSTDPIFTYTSSDPAVTFTGALSRVSGENAGAYAINQGTLAVVGNNYSIASFVPANFLIASPSTNANLSGLTFSTGALSPVFASGTTTYSQSVANTVTSLTVTPTLADTTATIKVNGATVASGSASGSISLVVGSNTITTIVTAQNGTTTKTYMVTVTRALSQAKDITSFSLTTPAATGVIIGTNIAITVPFGTDVAALIPTITHSGVSISPNGVQNFINPVSYRVTAEDSTIKDYMVTVTVAPDSATPVVSSIVRANTTPTSAASVLFTLTFSEPVTGVDAGDMGLTTTGTINSASITNVAGSGATRTVTVSTGSGIGTVRLDVSTTATITDLAGNPLSELPFNSGETYTLINRSNKPDLIITNVTINPAVPGINQTFEVNITVKNQGGETGPNIVYRDVYIDRDPSTLINPTTGCPPPGDFFRSDYFTSLPEGWIDTKTVTITGGLPAGSHQLWFYVDSRCLIDEGGGNNSAP